jgi:putative sugar O-methyltransferase
MFLVVRERKGTAMSATGRPSLFWHELAREHSDLLERHGFGEMKRKQALRYFTWQWRWRQVVKSEQFRFLLSETPKAALIRTVVTPQALSAGLWRGLPWGRGDRWLYSLATRLLWSYAEEHGDREVLSLGEPALGNPPPVVWRKSVVSQDLANCSLEGSAIRRALNGREPTAILEIGGGYGRTAYSLLGIFPSARYTILDIEPALSLSRFYLTSLYPDRDLRFVDAAEAETVGEVDLAVSISSLHEMTPEQVAIYLNLLDEVVVDGGTVFLKQWEQWHNPADDVEMRFDDYPVPGGWLPLFRETSPVQTRFIQAAWQV